MSGRSSAPESTSFADRAAATFGRLKPWTFSIPEARPAATLPLPGAASCCATLAATSAAPSVRLEIGASGPVPTLRLAMCVS